MMETEWNGHTIRVDGNWTARWLYLAPDYELWLDDEKLDRAGGPFLHPNLEAVIEDEDGEIHHLEVNILSIVGWRPQAEILIEGQAIHSDKVIVQNFINPFLVVIILVSTVVMLYLGPTVLKQY